MNRKQFIINTGLTAFAVSALGSVTSKANGTFGGDCETTNDILGPFYRPNAPLRKDLNFEGLKGNKISLQGQVFKSDCKSPVQNALVEIWHCDTEGEYDNDTAKFLHRARWNTNENGEYSFHTILPGKYLNGDLYRPSHIHFRITAPGYKEIVSQIYFKGDPHITKDPWASDKRAKQRILEIAPEDVSGGLVIRFNIYMADK